MVLVVGGIASGKRSYVASLGFRDADIATALGTDLPVLVGLEEILRRGPLYEPELNELCHKEVVCCLEVGLGVVPIDASERAWRELVGRTCAQLAQRADCVVRMVCGIPVRIK